MSAYNVVRFRVKDGCDQQVLDTHRRMERGFPGMRRGVIIKTGERSYCLIAEWSDFASIVAARPAMIGNLDRIRGLLEDQGAGLGVTDAVSGEVVLDL